MLHYSKRVKAVTCSAAHRQWVVARKQYLFNCARTAQQWSSFHTQKSQVASVQKEGSKAKYKHCKSIMGITEHKPLWQRSSKVPEEIAPHDMVTSFGGDCWTKTENNQSIDEKANYLASLRCSN